MKRKIVSLILAVCLISGVVPVSAASGYSDVPEGSWAEPYILKATELGIISGYGGGLFGYGDNVTRAQFAAMLVRLFGWQLVNPETSAFTDNADSSAWYYKEVETAAANGAVVPGGAFRPGDNITRSEMAVMLVSALGYSSLAAQLSGISLPFADVSENRAYIAMAYDFGIINGTSATTFEPNAPATREQAAAMMLRLYERYNMKTGFKHAFYAISSYSQIGLVPSLDAVSYGWSRLEYTDGAVRLNTSREGGNDYGIPSGYEEAVNTAAAGGVKRNLDVYMTASAKVTLESGATTDPCTLILTDAANRAAAVGEIIAAASSDIAFTGVTIDFEEMRGEALKAGFVEFLELLREGLSALNMELYVCVHPVTSYGSYYDAYDYRQIGRLADKVILMAHDYAAKSLTQSEMDSGYVWTPETPINEIYHALRAATNPDTGVEDISRLMLAVSFGSTQWRVQEGRVVNRSAYSLSPDELYARLADSGTTMNYSERYQNPYITYVNDDGLDCTVWYEDERSIAAKEQLAHMFGIGGLSVWRLGIIPDYGDSGIYFDAADYLFE